MPDLITDVLSNTWTVTIVGGVIVGVILLFIGRRLHKDSKTNTLGDHSDDGSGHNYSPSIHGNGNHVAGGDIIYGDKVTQAKESNKPIPEIHLQLNGRGATESFQGHIEKRSPETLVVLYIEIDGVRSEIGKPFTKLMPLKNLRFDPGIFTRQKDNIVIRVRYRDLEGNVFEHWQTAVQQKMAIDKFNVLPQGDIHLIRIDDTHESAKLFTMRDWTAKRTDNDQGSDWREIGLAGNSIEKLIFNVTPSAGYWRAGFKLVDPNESILPLRNAHSLLFHIQSTDDPQKYGITIYQDGAQVNSAPKTGKLTPGEAIQIAFEVNGNNFIKVYVNDSLEFEPAERISPRLLKKACLIAWGDERDYTVEFADIKFSLR